MSLRELLNKQIIRIDDHNRGNREEKDWDDKRKDVHIDKQTKFKINGKTQNITIRIPINSDREISTEINGNRNEELPYQLFKEIKKALQNDREATEAFAKDIVDEIKDYKSVLANEQKAQIALNRLSKHFDLEWTKVKIATYINETLESYTQIYRNKEDKKYYFTLNTHFLELSDITGWSRHEIWLASFR
jgi:uncharacterized protein YpuA (DUF1002 family)